MGKIIGLIGVLVLVAGLAFWLGRSSRPDQRVPSQEQMSDADILQAKCAHAPRDEIEECTMREYAKLHPKGAQH